eukprot:TRINITY_DN6665_c0_g1_i2.p1 TRINITY_DN6665_c0_g1~~TRINITY_DN6665_c0_g1_i2.p1  ORF type:complete len:317 (-),score=134.41 TRINITY_DN6665_c0_g1_i2:134-1084(-)
MGVKSDTVFGKCSACGEKNLLDNKHKFAGYIVKNPPTNKSEFKKKEEEKETKETKEGKKKGKADPEASGGKETSKKEEETKEEPKAVKKDDKPPVVLDELEITSPALAELVNRVQEVYTTEYPNVQSFDDNDDAVDRFWRVIKRFGIPENKKDRIPYILFNGLFNEKIAEQIKKNEYLLKEVLQLFGFKQDFEVQVLILLEYFFLIRYKEKGYEKYIPTILKLFYDNDILSDEFLSEWSQGKKLEALKSIFSFNEELDQSFKTHAESFISWLTADEEEEEEEEEEGEEEAENKEEAQAKQNGDGEVKAGGQKAECE